nr:MAG TPA: hypothetical protein [Caudoviricetes sp.]
MLRLRTFLRIRFGSILHSHRIFRKSMRLQNHSERSDPFRKLQQCSFLPLCYPQIPVA